MRLNDKYTKIKEASSLMIEKLEFDIIVLMKNLMRWNVGHWLDIACKLYISV